jgi:hypothetical protein
MERVVGREKVRQRKGSEEECQSREGAVETGASKGVKREARGQQQPMHKLR